LPRTGNSNSRLRTELSRNVSRIGTPPFPISHYREICEMTFRERLPRKALVTFRESFLAGGTAVRLEEIHENRAHPNGMHNHQNASREKSKCSNQ